MSFEPESLPTVSVSGDAAAGWKGDLLAVAVTQDDLTTTGARVLGACCGVRHSPWGAPSSSSTDAWRTATTNRNHHHKTTAPPNTGGDDAPEKAVSISSPALAALDASLAGALGDALAGGEFEGKAGSTSRAIRLGGGGASGPRFVALLGLGKAADLAGAAGGKWGTHPYQVGWRVGQAGRQWWGWSGLCVRRTPTILT